MITSKLYLGLPQDPDELLTNGDFETAGGGGADVFGTWTETASAGTEKITNGDMEIVAGDNFGTWVEIELGTGTVEDEQVIIHGGSHAMKITTVNSSNWAIAKQTITATVGKGYILSAWVKGDYGLAIYETPAEVWIEEGTAADWTHVTLPTWIAESTTIYIEVGPEGYPAANTAYIDDVSLLEEYTSVVDEGTIIHGGSHAAKLIGAGIAQGTVEQVAGANTALARQSLSFWSKGDGTDGLNYRVYDVTNSAWVNALTEAPISTDWAKTTYSFYAPTDCVSLKVYFYANGPGPFYLDDVSLLEYGEINWVVSEDVMASPAPVWEYGISGSGPMNLLAATGTASFALDNQDKEYSPEGGERVVGFEEGMPVKITTAMDWEIEIGDAGLVNGGFEAL